MKFFLLITFLLFSLFVPETTEACEHKVFAPTSYYSIADGDLNTNIWSTVSHTGPSCFCDPDGDNNCVIDAGSTVYIKHAVTSSCPTLTLGSNVTIVLLAGGSLTLAGNGSLAGSGTVTVAPGALLSVGGDLNLSGGGGIDVNGGTVNVYGNLTSSGTSDICGGSGTINVAGSIEPGSVCPTFGGVLPVIFTKFTVVQKEHAELLEWQTASEQNNNLFEIQRSTDGTNFEKIGEHKSKAGSTGNSNSLLDYLFEDAKPVAGYSYYRLKQIDFDNKFKYSAVVSVVFEMSKNISFVIYPNPNKGEFSVDFKGIENNHEIEVNVVDMKGKIVYKTIVYPESMDENSFKIVPDVNLPSGKYLVRMQIEGVIHTAKVVVE